jgi:hypothetical protein
MMQPYEDPQEHFERHITDAAGRYVEGLELAGLQPSDTLTKAVAARALDAAKADYEQHAYETLMHNIEVIRSAGRERDRQIQREGARLGLKMCPFMILFFGALAWLSLTQHSIFMGIAYVVAAAAFLAMLVHAWFHRV